MRRRTGSAGVATLGALLLGAPLMGAPVAAQAAWRPQDSGTTAELRGLSAAGPTVVWAAGRGGVFTVTTDGGARWRPGTVEGAEDLFFIDVHAVDARTAFLLGTSFDGGRARIYRTDDAGRSWEEQYASDEAGVFFDGMAFWDASRGVAFSDPVAGAWRVVRTENGGRSWDVVPPSALPEPLAGEAGFAASGTAVTTQPGGRAWIGTGGGSWARVLRTADGGGSWEAVTTPLPAGSAAGIFGLVFTGPDDGVAVGGDYTDPTGAAPNVLRSEDGGRSWALAGSTLPAGVKYGVVAVPVPAGAAVHLAAGPSGSGYSVDGGLTWTTIDTTGFNTLAVGGAAEPGGMQPVWAAGVNGRVARLAGALDGRGGSGGLGPGCPSAEAEIIAADLAFARDVADRGADAWVEAFAEDGLMFPAGGPAARGHDAIRDAMGPAFDAGLSLRWQPLGAEAGSGCDLGWSWGRYQSGEGEDAVVGKYVTIWRRGEDGRWRVVGDIGNTGAPR